MAEASDDIKHLEAIRRNSLLLAWIFMGIFVSLMGAAVFFSTRSEGWGQIVQVVPWMVAAVVAVSVAQRNFKKATEVEAKLGGRSDR